MGPDPLDNVEYRLDPSALIVAEHDGGLANAVAAASFRVVGRVGLADAVNRLDRQVEVDLVLVALAGDGGDGMDRLLDRVADGARAGRFRAIILLPQMLIDAVMARFTGQEATLLVDPEPLELAFALSLAAQPAESPVLRDIGAEGSSLRLIELSEEVGRLARQLAALAGERPGPPPLLPLPALDLPPAPAPPSPDKTISAGTLRAIIRARRLRDQFFDAGLFADPAWDILLDLTAARKERQEVPVSSLCIAAAVPPTTALRWINTLTERGMLLRRADPLDGRRVFIGLSEPTAAAMEACVARVWQAGTA